MVDVSSTLKNSTATSDLRELRFALVCYGGVSLAIYMHGITKEIHKLLLASAAFGEPENPFSASQTEHVYWELLHRMQRGEVGRSPGLQTRVVVDVISGTSAGGINGICLAKAITLNCSQEALKTLWFERGDIKQLAAAPKSLPLAAKAPYLILKSSWTGTPLRGDDMCRWLHGAFTEMESKQSSYPTVTSLLPPDHTLDLFVTTTDFQGYPRELPIYDPRIVTDIAHRHVLGFHHKSLDDTDFTKNHVLAFSARATSSFPGAFPPITFGDYEACFAPSKPELAKLADRQFAVYELNNVDPARSSFVDGGVLNNYPFSLAVRAFKGKPAAFEVVRRLLYIEPDPISAAERLSSKPAIDASGDEVNAPSWLSTIWAGLSTIPASQPVLDDLNNLAERNRVVRRIRDIIEVSFDTIRAHVLTAIGAAGLDVATMQKDISGGQLLSVRDSVEAKAEREAGYAQATYRRLRLRMVLRRYAAMIAKRLNFPDDSYPARFVETVTSDWAVAKGLLSPVGAAVKMPENLDEQKSLLADVDSDYQHRRIQFVISAFSWWYRDVAKPNYPTRAELDGAKDRLCKFLADLEGLVEAFAVGAGGKLLERAFPVGEVRDAARKQDRGYADRHLADLDELRRTMGREMRHRVTRLEGQLYKELMTRSAGWDRSVVVDLLVRYLGFPFWDTLVFPVQALHDVNERDHVEVVRISPYDATLLGTKASEKLKGTGLGHFAAFFKREFRENDYLWGRLDAAERLVGLLLEDPNNPGTPPPPTECRKVFTTILQEERAALTEIPDLIQKIAGCIERLPKT
jgi:patatin-related protein